MFKTHSGYVPGPGETVGSLHRRGGEGSDDNADEDDDDVQDCGESESLKVDCDEGLDLDTGLRQRREGKARERLGRPRQQQQPLVTLHLLPKVLGNQRSCLSGDQGIVSALGS